MSIIKSNLKVTTQGTAGAGQIHAAIVTNTKENWTVSVETKDAGWREDLELALITFKLPDGKVLSGNIQQFGALFHVVSNCKREMVGYAENGFTDKEDEREVLDCIIELDSVLAMFSEKN